MDSVQGGLVSGFAFEKPVLLTGLATRRPFEKKAGLFSAPVVL